MYRAEIFDNWRQDATWLNEAEAWPTTLFPDADYTWFRECGCLVCALAVMLWQSGLEEEAEGKRFDPWILNQRLITCGAFSTAGDLMLEEIRKLYPLTYMGSVPYSRQTLERAIESRILCLLTVPGIRAERHFITPLSLLPSDVVVFDPVVGERVLSEYSNVFEIREFRPINGASYSVIPKANNCEGNCT